MLFNNKYPNSVNDVKKITEYVKMNRYYAYYTISIYLNTFNNLNHPIIIRTIERGKNLNDINEL
ncbi:hypothetical protein D3C75_521620 [compost metagenome]